MTSETDWILRYFRRRCGHGRILHNAACHLVQLILERVRSDRIEDLMAFCANPENLRPWLPTETDRFIFSEGLLEGLRHLASRSGRDGSGKRVRGKRTSLN